VDGFAAGQRLSKGISALIVLDDGVYFLDAFQVGCPPIAPVARAGDA